MIMRPGPSKPSGGPGPQGAAWRHCRRTAASGDHPPGGSHRGGTCVKTTPGDGGGICARRQRRGNADPLRGLTDGMQGPRGLGDGMRGL